MSPSSPKNDRLSCRMDRDLLDWVRWYSRQRRTTVTRLVCSFFQDLRKRYESDSLNEVDQY